jgi:hypothetical protein
LPRFRLFVRVLATFPPLAGFHSKNYYKFPAKTTGNYRKLHALSSSLFSLLVVLLGRVGGVGEREGPPARGGRTVKGCLSVDVSDFIFRHNDKIRAAGRRGWFLRGFAGANRLLRRGNLRGLRERSSNLAPRKFPKMAQKPSLRSPRSILSRFLGFFVGLRLSGGCGLRRDFSAFLFSLFILI